jgi:hypothetical protein
MVLLFSPAKTLRSRRIRLREFFAAQFDGGRNPAALSRSNHLGYDELERRIVLTTSQDDFSFSQGTITGYRGVGGLVDIPSVIAGLPVVAIGDNAFVGNTAITSVVVPDGVTTIGNGAFHGNTSLTKLKIGNSVASIGEGAFMNASSLTTVAIPSSTKFIGANAFRYNSSLTSVAFAGDAPVIDVDAFTNVAVNAAAYRAAGLMGYGPDGSYFYGLIVATPRRR